MMRIVSLLLVLSGVTLAAYTAQGYWKFKNGSPSTRLQILWENDLQLLSETSSLPKFWQQIKTIQITPSSELAKKWMKSVSPPIAINPKGTYRLEILIISWDEEKEHGVIIQYNLIDLKTENMVWELGRTLIL